MIKEVNAEEYRAEDMSGLVLVDFYSSTCGPCRMWISSSETRSRSLRSTLMRTRSL